MYKTLEVIITQAGSNTLTTETLGTSDYILILSAVVQSSGTGSIIFSNGSEDFLCSGEVTGNVIDAIQTNKPVFSLNRTLKINTIDFPTSTAINVIVYYIEGNANNPLFSGSAKFAHNSTTTSSIGATAILSNTEEFIYNIKSIYVYTPLTTNNVGLLLETPVFTSQINITDPIDGFNDYQLLKNPLLLKQNSTLSIGMTEAVSTLICVSYTRGAA
jgi:hypothetical protein